MVIPYVTPIMHQGKQSHTGQVDRCDKPHLIIKDLIVNDFEHKKQKMEEKKPYTWSWFWLLSH